MRIVVLLSAGLHPVSGRPCPVPVELQAIGLAQALLRNEPRRPGAGVVGLHAGEATPSVLDCFGHGLSTIEVLEQANGDPGAALVAAIRRATPDLVLAGHRSRGGDDTGLVPYGVAASLGWPICPDGVGLARHKEGFEVIQALPRGARRRVVLAAPSIVTVHPAAPAAPAFAFAAARRGNLVLIGGDGPIAPADPAISVYPYRRRPRLLRGVTFGGSAESRLKAATEISGGGQVMIDPVPEEAADAISALLGRLGLLAV
jgi:electron transfer flavoprotein beta subunit